MQTKHLLGVFQIFICAPTFAADSNSLTDGITETVRNITGTIISAEDGTTLIGVSVMIKGTTTGTVTDLDGNLQSTQIPMMYW